MMRSTGGEQRTVGRDELAPFEGLVFSTARMYSGLVRREEDDLAQELRVIVWRAVRKYDSSRSTLTLERFVFQAITNKIKDYKRDAARESDRQKRHGVSFVHIEDVRLGWQDNSPITSDRQEAFDSRYHFTERDDVYGHVENERFVLPAGVTERECAVLLLLMMECSRAEIVVQLQLSRADVCDAIASLRQKFADWRPDQPVDSSSPVKLSPAHAGRAGAELVGSQAA